MDRSPPAAPHPASRRRSCSRLQAGERIPEEDFHLSDQTRFQAHWNPRSTRVLGSGFIHVNSHRLSRSIFSQLQGQRRQAWGLSWQARTAMQREWHCEKNHDALKPGLKTSQDNPWRRHSQGASGGSWRRIVSSLILRSSASRNALLRMRESLWSPSNGRGRFRGVALVAAASTMHR